MDYHDQYKVVILGGGSAGILAVSELVAQDVVPILWIDPSFSCGELKSYRSIPTNNQVVFEKQLIEENSWIKKTHLQEDYLQPIANLAPTDYTTLDSTYSTLTRMQSDILKLASDKVKLLQSRAKEFRETEEGTWVITTEDQQEVQQNRQWQIRATYVFWCIGGNPKQAEKVYPTVFAGLDHLQSIPLIDAISPDRIRGRNLSEDVVAVFGRSNTGILAVKELVELPVSQRPKKVYLFYKGPPRWEVDPQGDKISYTQKWYQQAFNPDPPENVELYEFKDEVVRAKLLNCTKYVTAIGYQRNPMGQIYLNDGRLLADQEIKCDQHDNFLFIGEGRKLHGMFGFGIAFPQKWVDPNVIIDDPAGFLGSLVTVQRVVKHHLIPVQA